MPSVQQLAVPILEAHPASLELDLEIGGEAIRVRTNSEKLRALLADYFRYWVAVSAKGTRRHDIVVTAIEADEPVLPLSFTDWVRDPGKTGRKDEYADLEGGRAVRKVRTGMQYLLGDGLRLTFGPCCKNDNQVVNFVVAQYINLALARGGALCHAAAVHHNGRGLALAGISGAGKSTLALHLMEHSADFVSNDRLLVGPGGSAHGFPQPWMWGVPKQPRINPGTALSLPSLSTILSEQRRGELADLDRDALWDLEEKYDVDIGRVYGEGRWRAEGPLSAFLLLRWHRSSQEPTRLARVELAERRDLLPMLMKAPGPFYQPPSGIPEGVHRQGEDEYLKALEGVHVYEATGRVDFELAVKTCLGEYLA